MQSILLPPPPSLSAYIDNYQLVDIDWTSAQAPNNVWRLIPYGKVSMLFLYGDPYRYSLQGPNAPMQEERLAFLIGPLLQPVWMKFSGRSRLIKVQFSSSGAQRFLPVNMEELRTAPSLDLAAVWGNATYELLEQLDEAASDADRIDRLSRFLEKRLRPAPDRRDYVDYTIHRIQASKGNLSIKELEKQLGISTRHLERLFQARIGISPKKLGKLLRLNQAFSSLLENPALSLTDLSYEAGYYDQSHFCRDFKAVSGVSPTDFTAQRNVELFVTHGACLLPQAHAVSQFPGNN